MNESQLLSQIKNRSLVYDLETGGFDPGKNPLIEGGIQDLRSGQLARAAFGPHFRHPIEEDWRVLRGADYTNSLDPWPRRMLESGPWSGFKHEPQAHPASWLRQNWVEPLAQGKWLWAHNARFDLKFISANLDRPDYDRAAGALGRNLSKDTRAHRQFHVTAGRDTFLHTQAARKNVDNAAANIVNSYSGFLSHMERAAANPHQGLVLDSQYLMQAALAHAQEKGLITRTNDVFTGTSVEAARWAFHPEEMSGEAHTVAEDISGTGSLIENYLTLIGDIRTKKPKDLSDAQKQALLFHQELQTHRTPLFQEKARTSFLKARYDLERRGLYELEHQGRVQTYSQNFNDILGVYDKLQKGRGYNLDLAAIHGQIAGQSLTEVEDALAQGSNVSEGIMRQARLQAESKFREGRFKAGAFEFKIPGAWKQAATRAKDWSKNRPGMLLMGGIAAIMAGMAVIPGKDDHYNTIEGLEHGWFGQRRQDITDFGSGYKGSDYSRGVVEKDLDLYDAAKEELHKHWGRYIMGAALTTAAAAFISKPTATARFFKNLPGEIWKDIKKNKVVFGAGMGLGFYHEERREETLTPAKWATLELAGMIDDVAVVAMSAAAKKFEFAKRWEASPSYNNVLKVVHAAGSAGIGYSTGRALAAGLKMSRRYLQKRRQENQKTTGLVQHLDRQKIHHTRMNGY